MSSSDRSESPEFEDFPPMPNPINFGHVNSWAERVRLAFRSIDRWVNHADQAHTQVEKDHFFQQSRLTAAEWTRLSGSQQDFVAHYGANAQTSHNSLVRRWNALDTLRGKILRYQAAVDQWHGGSGNPSDVSDSLARKAHHGGGEERKLLLGQALSLRAQRRTGLVYPKGGNGAAEEE